MTTTAPTEFLSSEEVQKRLRELGYSRGASILALLALDRGSSDVEKAQQTLEVLRRSPAERDRAAAVRHLASDPGALTFDPGQKVRHRVALYSTDASALLHLLKDDDAEVSSSALSNPALPLEDVSLDDVKHVNADVNPDHLRFLLEKWGENVSEVMGLWENWEGTIGSLVEAGRLIQR